MVEELESSASASAGPSAGPSVCANEAEAPFEAKLESADGSESSGVMVELMTFQATGEGLRLRSPRPSSEETGLWVKLRGCGEDCEGRSRTMRDDVVGSDESSGGEGRLEEAPLRDCGRSRSRGGGRKVSVLERRRFGSGRCSCETSSSRRYCARSKLRSLEGTRRGASGTAGGWPTR